MTRKSPCHFLLAIPSLIDILRNDDDLRMQHSIIRVLAVFGAQAAAATPDLLDSFKLRHPTVTKMASRTLSRIGPAALPAVIRGLASSHGEVRRGCAMTLAQMNEKAVPILLKVLAGDNDVARASAVDAIHRIGQRAQDAAPTLITILQDDQTDPRLRAAIKSALGRITVKDQPMSSPRRPAFEKSLASSNWASEVPAFPGAEGFGASAACLEDQKQPAAVYCYDSSLRLERVGLASLQAWGLTCDVRPRSG